MFNILKFMLKNCKIFSVFINQTKGLIVMLPLVKVDNYIGMCPICRQGSEEREGSEERDTFLAHEKEVENHSWHAAHEKCLRDWALIEPSCPICKKPIDTSNLISSVDVAKSLFKKVVRSIGGAGGARSIVASTVGAVVGLELGSAVLAEIGAGLGGGLRLGLGAREIEAREVVRAVVRAAAVGLGLGLGLGAIEIVRAAAAVGLGLGVGLGAREVARAAAAAVQREA